MDPTALAPLLGVGAVTDKPKTPVSDACAMPSWLIVPPASVWVTVTCSPAPNPLPMIVYDWPGVETAGNGCRRVPAMTRGGLASALGAPAVGIAGCRGTESSVPSFPPSATQLPSLDSALAD